MEPVLITRIEFKIFKKRNGSLLSFFNYLQILQVNTWPTNEKYICKCLISVNFFADVIMCDEKTSTLSVSNITCQVVALKNYEKKWCLQGQATSFFFCSPMARFFFTSSSPKKKTFPPCKLTRNASHWRGAGKTCCNETYFNQVAIGLWVVYFHDVPQKNTWFRSFDSHCLFITNHTL